MITYRLHEFGVEQIENGRSTFIAENPNETAWREYQTWCGLGNEPAQPPEHPFAGSSPATRRLFIIGAGTYGREIYWMSRTACGVDRDWSVVGFLSDVPDTLDDFPEMPPIIGTTDYEPGENDVFICAIGDPKGRGKVTERLRSQGARFINLIHPSALISGDARLGEGLIIEAFVGIGTNSRIGDFCSILGHVNIGHDVTLADCVQVSPFACILGEVSIGENVFVGSHAVILPKIKVGAGAKIGAGAVVISDVPAGATVFGMPAKRLV